MLWVLSRKQRARRGSQATPNANDRSSGVPLPTLASLPGDRVFAHRFDESIRHAREGPEREEAGPEARLSQYFNRSSAYQTPVVGQPPLPVGVQPRVMTPVPVCLAMVNTCALPLDAFDFAVTV